MTGPELEPIDPEIERLLEGERARTAVPDGAQDRVFARVATTLGFPPPGGGAPGAGHGHPPGTSPAHGAASAAARTGIRALVAKPLVAGALGFALGGATGAGVVSALNRPAPVTSVASTQAIKAPPTASVASAPSAISVPVLSATPPTPPTAAAPAAPPHSARRAHTDAGNKAERDARLAEERSLIAQAQAAIARGRGDQALAALNRHAREFPHGQLTEEREALYVQALVAAGRRQQAQARARQFERRFPKSYLLPVVRAAVH